MVLPYTQVQYIFGTSAVSPALATYYGCIMGEAVKLHDLATHGWFTPGEYDCGGRGATADFNGRTYKSSPMTITPEGLDNSLPFPNLTKGNVVSIPTIKTYYRNLKSVSLSKIGDSDALWSAIPLGSSKFRVVKDADGTRMEQFKTPAEDQTKLTSFLFDETTNRIAPVFDGMTLDDPTHFTTMIPGRTVLTVKAGESLYYLADVRGTFDPATNIGHKLEEGIKGATGRFYLYDSEGKYCGDTALANTITYSFNSSSGMFEFKGYIEGRDVTLTDLIGLSYCVAEYGNSSEETYFAGTRTSAENGQDMFYLGPRYHRDATTQNDTADDPDDDDEGGSGGGGGGDVDVITYVMGDGTGGAIGDGAGSLIAAPEPEPAPAPAPEPDTETPGSEDSSESEGEDSDSGSTSESTATANPKYVLTLAQETESVVTALGFITVDCSELGTELNHVKHTFLKATSQKTLLPHQSGAAVSLGRMDHGSWIVESNYTVFNSSPDYAPCFGVAVCRVADDHPVRVDIDVDQISGEIEVDESTILFDKRDYDWIGGESVYVVHYDTDPDDRPDEYGAPVGNFVSGDFRIEYQELIKSPVLTGENGLHRTDLLGNNETMEDYIGQNDPRNPLGYAYALVREMTSADFYTLAFTDLQQGLETLEKYRNIFHIWLVSGDGPQNKFYNWIDKENQKEQSRFRIGYQYKPIKDNVTRADNIRCFLEISLDNAYPYVLRCTGAKFASQKGIIPGDTVEDVLSGLKLTVQTVNEDSLEIADEYIPTYPMKAAYDDEEDDGSWSFTYDKTAYNNRNIQSDSCRIKIKYTYTEVDPVNPSSKKRRQGKNEGAWLDMSDSLGEFFTFTAPEAGNLTWKVTPLPDSDSLTDIKIIDCAFDFRFESYYAPFDIYRVYNTQEKTDRLAADQTSTNMACVTVLTRSVMYSSPLYRSIPADDAEAIEAFQKSSAVMEDFEMMPDYATPGLIFGTKLSVQPHMPLTLVSFSLPGMGEVRGMREFSHDNLETLLAAGYCMINSEIGGLPYCETDCTVGYPMYGDSDRGLLSKINPVLMYGKDVYQVTKDWKGPMNTGTPELLSGLGTALVVLKKKYTETPYNLLGTLLKSVADAVITFDGSHVVIEHHISSQDPARYIDNIVYVE
jgi:hypothetical protein